MSGYTIGEIIIWLLLSALLGFLLGWLMHTMKCEREHGVAEPAVATTSTTGAGLNGAAAAEPAQLAKSAAPLAAKRASAAKKSVAKKAPAAKKAAAKKVAVKKASAKKVAVKKAPAKKVAVKKVAAKNAPPKKAAAKKVAVKKAPPKKASATKVAVKKAPAEKAVTPGKFPGSAMPLPGGRAPSAAYTIKGNEDSMIYHTPDGPFYTQTIAETWFKTEPAAVAAGFRKPRNA